jgi:GNAT superfamily N-acetyltransferase
LTTSTANPKLRIELAEEIDAASVAELLGQLGYPVNADEARARISEINESSSQVIFIAKFDGTARGLIHCYVRSSLRLGSEVEIDTLVVDEEHRGLGMAGRLIRSVERWAIERDVPSITLSTNIQRLETHDYYRKRGFEVIKKSLVFRREVLSDDE